MERIQATYLIETPYQVEQAAAVLAGEQSSGTFVSVPGETDELKTRFAARVEAIEVLDEVSAPSMPGEIIDNKTYTQAKVTVSWSVENF
jgi:ribulose-bisphosphate carboxylase large chain